MMTLAGIRPLQSVQLFVACAEIDSAVESSMPPSLSVAVAVKGATLPRLELADRVTVQTKLQRQTSLSKSGSAICTGMTPPAYCDLVALTRISADVYQTGPSTRSSCAVKHLVPPYLVTGPFSEPTIAVYHPHGSHLPAAIGLVQRSFSYTA